MAVVGQWRRRHGRIDPDLALFEHHDAQRLRPRILALEIEEQVAAQPTPPLEVYCKIRTIFDLLLRFRF